MEVTANDDSEDCDSRDESSESSGESGSDLDGFVVPDDGFMDEETLESLKAAARAAVEVRYPRLGRALFEEIARADADQEAINKMASDKQAVNAKVAEDAIAVLHDKLDTHAEPRRLAVAMAAHRRLGADSRLQEIVAHHDVVMMILTLSGRFEAAE